MATVECEVVDLESYRRGGGLVDPVGAAVAALFAIGPDRLKSASRGTARAALARQVQIYLLHVGFGLDPTALARLVRRDRATVVHACATIEDRRDDGGFDAALGILEASLRRWTAVFAEAC